MKNNFELERSRSEWSERKKQLINVGPKKELAFWVPGRHKNFASPPRPPLDKFGMYDCTLYNNITNKTIIKRSEGEWKASSRHPFCNKIRIVL